MKRTHENVVDRYNTALNHGFSKYDARLYSVSKFETLRGYRKKHNNVVGKPRNREVLLSYNNNG